MRTRYTTAPPDGSDAGPAFDETAYANQLSMRLVLAEPLPDGAVEALAQRRVETVRKALLKDGALDPTRIEVLPPATVALTVERRITMAFELGNR